MNTFSKIVMGCTSTFILAGCGSTGESGEGSFLDNLTSNFADQAEEAPAWASEPLIQEDKCDSFSKENITSFVLTYQQQPFTLQTSASEAGKRAMQTYTLASALINRSQLCLAESLNLKATSEILLKEKEILLSGTSLSKKEIEKHRAYSSEASKEIQLATSKIDELSPEKRKTFILGVGTYLAGSYQTVRIKEAVANYLSKTSDTVTANASLAQSSGNNPVGWLVAGLNIATTATSGAATMYNIGGGLPDHLTNLYDTSQHLIEFSQSENLSLPSDITDEFMSVTGW
jgi:hypothetical protein